MPVWHSREDRVGGIEHGEVVDGGFDAEAEQVTHATHVAAGGKDLDNDRAGIRGGFIPGSEDGA